MKYYLIIIFWGSASVSVQSLPDEPLCNALRDANIAIWTALSAAKQQPAPIIFCAKEFQPPLPTK